MIRLAQLSDTHLVADPAGLVWGHDGRANLESVVESFPMRPDVVVVTGDLSEDGSVDSYRSVRAITSALADEVHYVAGNHDDGANMAAVLGAGEPVRAVALSSHWTMALVNSQWPAHDEGRIEPETLASLDETLARATTHVVVGIHHPPRSTCALPCCGIVNASELTEVLERHERVRAVLSGHLHRSFDTEHDGVMFLGAPSTLRQLEHGEPHFQETDAPPAARIVELDDDGALTSSFVCAR